MTEKSTALRWNRKSRIQTLVDFFPYLTRQTRNVAAAYCVSMLGVVLALMLPWPLKFMIDGVLGDGTTVSVLQGFSVQQQVVLLAIAMAILASLLAVVLSVDKILHAKVRERFSYWLRDDLVQQLYRLSRASRQREMSGELTMRLVSDAQLVSRLFCKTLPVTVKHLANTVLTLSAILLISLPIGMVALLMALLLAAIVHRYGPRLARAAAKKRDHEGRVSALTQETVKGIEHVQAMALEDQSRSRYLEEAANSLRAGVNEVRVAISLERNSQHIAGLALALVAGMGGVAVTKGSLSLGTLTVCLAYIVQLLKPIEKINQVAASVSRGIARTDRIRALFQADTLPETVARIGVGDDIRQIECVAVGFRYPGDDEDTICEFTHTFRQGECTMIAGPSGCGKSTLLRLLLGLVSPLSGKILLDGQEYKQVDSKAMRSEFAVLLQDAHLFAGRIRDILSELKTNATDEQLWQVLAEVRLLELVDALPEGLDTPIDEAGTRISGGQRARLLLARALLSGRSVLVLDEPFANLDAESKRIIQHRIAIAKRDRVVIVVSHEQSLFEIADCILTPDDFQAGRPAKSIISESESQHYEADCAYPGH